MKEYYSINKARVVNITKLYLLAFGVLAIASVAVLVYFFTLELFLGIGLGFLAVLLLTTFLVLQALVTGNYDFQRRRRTFAIPFIKDYLQQNNFGIVIHQPISKWDFNEEIMQGNLYGFLVAVDIDEENPKQITFKFYTNRIPLNKEKFNSIMLLLKSHTATLEADGVLMKLDFTRLRTAQELSDRITLFMGMLVHEGFTARNF